MASFTDENKKVTQELIRHLQLGKSLLNRNRKPIGDRTSAKYNIWLTKLSKWLGKPFSQLTQLDVDNFRTSLRNDEIRDNTGKPYSASTKRDIEIKMLKTVLQFVKKPEMALYSTQYNELKEVAALSKEEVENVISQSKLRDKVIIQLLFDGGFRADEFLHVRFSDVYDDALKSGGYYKIRIVKSKTLPRTVGLTLPLSTEVLEQWLKMNKEKVGTSEPLIKLSYRHFNLIVSRSCLNVLKKKVTPHTLRHSSATYYCHNLSRYQLCKRYGWSMNSGMPATYIDREGVEDDTINKKMTSEENTTLQKEVNKLQEQLSQKNEQLSSVQSDMEEQIVALQKQIGGIQAGLIQKGLRAVEEKRK
jgi:integrase